MHGVKQTVHKLHGVKQTEHKMHGIKQSTGVSCGSAHFIPFASRNGPLTIGRAWDFRKLQEASTGPEALTSHKRTDKNEKDVKRM